MLWRLSWRADPAARRIADRHYNRQSVGSDQFVPPGRCLVLAAPQAFWVTSWPFADYVKHAWAGAWVCSAFRREGGAPAVEFIRDAVAATRWRWPEPPALGMVTFLDREKVRPTMVRGVPVWGWTWLKAGFIREPCLMCGGNGRRVDEGTCEACEGDGQARTESDGLLVFRLPPLWWMPAAAAPLGSNRDLWEAV